MYLYGDQNNYLILDKCYDNSNKKFLWIPAFNINTNLFTSDLGMNQLINIKNNEDKDIEIKEYNEFLKINYLPDCNKDKNIARLRVI